MSIARYPSSFVFFFTWEIKSIPELLIRTESLLRVQVTFYPLRFLSRVVLTSEVRIDLEFFAEQDRQDPGSEWGYDSDA